ncbi:hypothetical protein J7E97_14395 [Streptomyces sp. ISL-66]|uniref:DUF6153 family protein n=1 Tax=Streptomyces sp. ISL-66 TaxID=2819186 RepID=UPI001BE66DD5|nr:DUF6153 family protein [Streptomyces sp. ISL-66]MBT2469025.1 hypothetical protein [Streptomyces sp. ISL-66]
MSRQVRRAGRPFGLRASLLLVLAVLTGLVAMHGLGPVAIPAAAHHAAAGEHAPGEHCDPAASPADHSGRVHAGEPAHDGCGGHAQHADATCAATGTSGAPVLPVPAVMPGTVTSAAAVAHGTEPDATACGRAPPSLSELQLLRI